MNHDRARILLPAFADYQLGPIQRFLAARHIAICPHCMVELDAIQATRNLLKTSLALHRAPPSLAARIGSALPKERAPITRRRSHVWGFGGSALAGALAGVALTLIVTRLTPEPDPLLTDVVADHVRSLMADHLTDVPTSDQHTVKPWLSARLDLSPVVKDFADEGFPLVGGRLDYLDGHRAAAIVYRRDKHIINLFAFVSNDPKPSPPNEQMRDGFNIIRWRMGGLTYIAVSDVELSQLHAFMELVRG